MVERLLILKNMNVSNESDNGRSSAGQSFNTDDDDSLQTGVDNSKRSVAFLTSPSIDSVNDPEGSISDNPLSEKLKRKKLRRSTLKLDSNEQKRPSMKNRSWLPKVDLTKPILFLLFLCLIYLMWAKRDVWIPRLLTSNSRIKHTIQRNEDKSNSKEDLISTKDSTLSSNKEDSTIDDKQTNEDETPSDADNDEESPTISNKQNSHKLNIRIRRNKMSFTRDKQTKANRHSKYRIIDDDDDDDNDDDEDDDDDDDDDNNNNEEISRKPKEVMLPSITHSSKKHHRHRSDHSHKSKTSSNAKTGSIILRPHDDLVEQLRKLIKSHGKHRDFLHVLTKETGLTKSKVNKLVHQKDFSVLTIDHLLSLLNSFHSTILIVPK